MAKTISDIIHELYEKTIWGWCDNRVEARQYFGMGCKQGMEAVLKEIEGFIADLPCKTQGEIVNQQMLLKRIRELKGE